MKYLRLSALALLLLLPSSAVAQLSGLAPPQRAQLVLFADRTAYEPGETVRLAARVAIDSGWNIQAEVPTFEYLIPTRLSLEPPEGWPEPSLRYPPPEQKSFGFEDVPLAVYGGTVYLLAELAVPNDAAEGTVPVRGVLTYQACDDRQCLAPTTTEDQIELRVGGGGRPANAEVFRDVGGDPGRDGERPVLHLGLMLLLALLGGLILNAMPCVLPVLSLKVFALVKEAGKGRAEVVVGALTTSLGILVSFWVLALGAVVARAAGASVGWGIQFQEPVFVTFLTVVVVLFCLNLWGLFEIPLPSRLARLTESGPRQGVPGHLATGMFATLMATPCSAPFLGTAVGFALAQEAATILAIFTAVGVGMALPYLAVAVAPGALRLLPRPGPWTETLKGVMGFLLAGAAVWLFFVLAAQISAERLALLKLGLLGMALFLWLRQGRPAVAPARRLGTLGVVASVLFTLGVPLYGGEIGREPTEVHTERIAWVPFERQRLDALVADGRLVFVDVTADWCFTCKVNERLVLETRTVADAFEAHEVVPMKADWTNRDPEIGAYLAEFGRYGIPFYVLYRPGQEPHLFGELITRDGIVSTVRSAAANQLPTD